MGRYQGDALLLYFKDAHFTQYVYTFKQPPDVCFFTMENTLF